MTHSILNQPYHPSKALKEHLTRMCLESLCVEIIQHRELDSLSFAEQEMVSRLEKEGYLSPSLDGWVGERIVKVKKIT